LGDNINSIKKSTETVINATKEVGLEVNGEKTKYMLLSRDQTVRQNHHNIKKANGTFENVARFRYLGTTITSQNLMQEIEFG
jgi:hypothetical protein